MWARGDAMTKYNSGKESSSLIPKNNVMEIKKDKNINRLTLRLLYIKRIRVHVKILTISSSLSNNCK